MPSTHKWGPHRRRAAYQARLHRSRYRGWIDAGGLQPLQVRRHPGSATKMAAAIAAAEAARPHSGRTVTASLTPQLTQIDLGGPIVRTLAFGDKIPGPLIRAKVGDELVVKVSNRLDHPTSVHWHGIALRNDMDGAEPATPNIEAGQEFTYQFSVPNSGTYWAHPHTGLDEDIGSLPAGYRRRSYRG